jgi:hypothetical protein
VFFSKFIFLIALTSFTFIGFPVICFIGNKYKKKLKNIFKKQTHKNLENIFLQNILHRTKRPYEKQLYQ